MEFRLLRKDEIEVKVKQVKEKGAVALLYKTARTDMALLDETVGAENWQCDYREIKGNMYCGIGVYLSPERGYVWKWNCGTESREDGEGNEKKGEASDAFKRAGTLWGIGRELYTSPFIFLNVETKEKNGNYILADKFQSFEVDDITYEGRVIKTLKIVDNRGKVVFDNSKRVAAPHAQSANADTPPKPRQNQAKTETGVNAPEPTVTPRKTQIQALMAQHECPSDPVKLFMGAAGKAKFDDLDDKQWADLLNMVRHYGKTN